MRNLLLRFQKSLRAANSGYVSAMWQGILHLASVYFIAWLCMPWLLDVAYGHVLPFLLGHPLRGNPFQFAFSHLLALSFLPGFAAGFGNAKSLRNGVVRFVWLVPVVVLVFLFVFRGPGMYPTLFWESDFGQAFHYFFGGGIQYRWGIPQLPRFTNAHEAQHPRFHAWLYSIPCDCTGLCGCCLQYRGVGVTPHKQNNHSSREGSGSGCTSQIHELTPDLSRNRKLRPIGS